MLVLFTLSLEKVHAVLPSIVPLGDLPDLALHGPLKASVRVDRRHKTNYLLACTLRLYPIPNVRDAVGDSNTHTHNRSRRRGRPPDECISDARGASGGGPPPYVRFRNLIQQVKTPM